MNQDEPVIHDRVKADQEKKREAEQPEKDQRCCVAPSFALHYAPVIGMFGLAQGKRESDIIEVNGGRPGAIVGTKLRLSPKAPAMNKPAQTWQDIATAPRDGTEILAYNDEGVRCVIRYGEHNHVPLQGWIRQVELYGEEVDGFDPLGWMPLPAAPNGKQG